jgi:hypothetical protein
LVHGLIDENVHFRHTARLINALIQNRKRYDLVLFPCERHSPHKLQDRVYLEDRMTDFFVECLRSPPLTREELRTIYAALTAAGGSGARLALPNGWNNKKMRIENSSDGDNSTNSAAVAAGTASDVDADANTAGEAGQTSAGGGASVAVEGGEGVNAAASSTTDSSSNTTANFWSSLLGTRAHL